MVNYKQGENMCARDLIDREMREQELDFTYEYDDVNYEDRSLTRYFWRIRQGRRKIANSNRYYDTVEDCQDALITFITRIRNDNRVIMKCAPLAEPV